MDALILRESQAVLVGVSKVNFSKAAVISCLLQNRLYLPLARPMARLRRLSLAGASTSTAMTFKNPTQETSMRRSPDTGGAEGLWIPDAVMSSLKQRRQAPIDRSNLVSLAKKIKEFRAVRGAVFAPELFGEPAWDLLLALYIAGGDQYRLKVTDACAESNVPESTALRWISSMAEAGLIRYDSNPTDARSRYVALSNPGIAMMDHLLEIASGNFKLI